MSEWKVGLTQEAMDNSEQTIQCLIEASNEIFKASEADFKQMKSKKWYNRLWETITFSKDNEKKLANGVANLAKLQEIVMKALLILSNKNAEIAAIVEENSTAIQRLSKNQVAVIKEIEKLKYGYDRQLNLWDLNENKLYIVVNTLAKLAMETPSGELGKRYVQTILRTAGFSNVNTSLNLEDIEDYLKADEAVLLYQILEEYLYLATGSFDSESEIFDYISLSSRKCQKIQQRIKETDLIAGTEFFIEYYGAENDEYMLIDDNDVTFTQETEANYINNETDPIFIKAHEAYMNYDIKSALGLFTYLAEEGNGRACYYLSKIYRLNLDNIIGKCDKTMAAKWSALGNERGDVLSRIEYAYTIEDNDEKNNIFQEVFSAIIDLAEQGDIVAITELGFMYDCGYGVDRNVEKALYWYKIAAEKGDWRALNNYGSTLISQGKVNEGINYLKKASDIGYELTFAMMII